MVGEYVSTFLETDGNVWHIEIDAADKSRFLFADGNALRYNTPDGSIKTVVGSPAEFGYKAGRPAMFNSITGFVQMSASEVIVVDRNNHCLRQVDRNTTIVRPYVGRCQRRGDVLGQNARFSEPWGVYQDIRNPRILYVTDSKNSAIKIVDTTTRTVKAFIKDSRMLEPSGLLQTDKLFYLTTSNGVWSLTRQSDLSLVSGPGDTSRGFSDGLFRSAMYKGNREIIQINETTLAVADSSNHRVRVLDLIRDNVTSICNGDSGHVNEALLTCSLTYVYSLISSNDNLYFGEYQRIRMITGRVIINNLSSVAKTVI